MPEIEEKGSAGGPEPTSDQAVSGNVDEGTVEDDEGADSSSPKSPRLSTSPVPVPGSETNVTPDDPAHEAGVNEQEKQQDSSSAVKVDNSKDSLEDFDWDDLEQRFCTAMEKFQKIEDEIGEEYRQWLQVFKAWAAVTSVHEPERAHKRLRTRIAWVQGAEKDVEEKRRHYVNVVKAFESALALLGGI